MSIADELLNELEENQISLMLADPSIEPHIVVTSDRFITVPNELMKIAVQYDHKVETITFDCPRYWDGLDMSEMRVYINYKRSDGKVGMSLGKNVVVDEVDPTVMHFDWTITRGATLVVGTLSFSVCIKKPNVDGNEENHWNSEINDDMYIAPGLEYEEQKNPQQADLISDLIDRMEATENAVETAGIHVTTAQMNSFLAQFDSLKEELAKRTETVVFPAVIEATGWSVGVPPYISTVSIPGVKPTDSPHATPMYSDDAAIALEQEDAWNMISDGKAVTDGIEFKCFGNCPSIDIPIQVECFRTWKE